MEAHTSPVPRAACSSPGGPSISIGSSDAPSDPMTRWKRTESTCDPLNDAMPEDAWFAACRSSMKRDTSSEVTLREGCGVS